MMRKGSARSKWPWRLWYWTAAHESLFDLDAEAMYTWTLLVDEAFK